MDAGDAYEDFKRRNMTTWRQKHWSEAELAQMQPYYEHPRLQADRWGVLEVVETGNCPQYSQRPGSYQTATTDLIRCKNPAGYGTTHAGFGKCYRHAGHNGRGLYQGAILMALAYADELSVSPWEALLSQLKLLANQVEWLRLRVHEYETSYGVEGLKPGGEGYWAVEMLEARGDRLAKVAKNCIDAGIAKQLVQNMQVEAENMAKAALTAADALGLSDLQRDQFMEVMSEKLLELEGSDGRV